MQFRTQIVRVKSVRRQFLRDARAEKCGVVIKAFHRASEKSPGAVVAAAAESERRREFCMRGDMQMRAAPARSLCTQQSRELKWVRKWHGVEFALFAGVQNIELKLNGKDTKGNHMVGV
jgi:hypothetical protein